MKSRVHIKNCFYRFAVNRIDHQSNDHPQDVFPLLHTIPRISIWFQWFVIALPHSELQLLWHSHQNFIAYLINYFCKEVHFPPKRLPPLHYHKEWEEVETLRSVAAELRSWLSSHFPLFQMSGSSSTNVKLHSVSLDTGGIYRSAAFMCAFYFMCDNLWCKNSTKW